MWTIYIHGAPLPQYSFFTFVFFISFQIITNVAQTLVRMVERVLTIWTDTVVHVFQAIMESTVKQVCFGIFEIKRKFRIQITNK